MDWLGSENICHLCTCEIYCNKNRISISLLLHPRFTPTSVPFVPAAGIRVDELVMQLVGLRYTEPDMTISYPGFLYLLMKLESMIRKSGWRGERWGCKHCHSFLPFRGDEHYKLETVSGFNHHTTRPQEKEAEDDRGERERMRWQRRRGKKGRRNKRKGDDKERCFHKSEQKTAEMTQRSDSFHYWAGKQFKPVVLTIWSI